MGLGLLKNRAGAFGKKGALGALGILLLAEIFLPPEEILARERPKEKNSQEETGVEEKQEAEFQKIYPLIYGEWPGSSKDIIELREPEREYQVLPGDCLWTISEKLWGAGKWYGGLMAEDGGTLENPNLIYPGMTLRAVQKGYICRRYSQNRGMQMGEYSMDTPGSWTVGTISAGDASANLVLSGDGFNKILCLIQDKRKETVSTTKDWEVCTEKIRSYAEQYYGENVSELSFEHYQTGQEEEVYLYSFLWQMELPEHTEIGKVRIRICMGLKLTEHIQAEFLGFASRYDIHGGVRYTTASFEEHTEDNDPEIFTVNDSNMSILPEAEWELEGMYDPFSWMEEFFGTLLERAAGIEPEPESVREGLIDKIGRTGERR